MPIELHPSFGGKFKRRGVLEVSSAAVGDAAARLREGRVRLRREPDSEPEVSENRITRVVFHKIGF